MTNPQVDAVAHIVLEKSVSDRPQIGHEATSRVAISLCKSFE